MNFLVVILSCVVLGISAANVDYCSAPYKEVCVGPKHVGCEPPASFGKDCPKDVYLYKASEIKDHLIKYHNYYRNKIALGNLPRYKSAKRMATMQWDDELAKLAEINVKTCKFEHDRCRATTKFRQAGQNIAMQMLWGGAPIPSTEELANKTVTMWFNENQKGNMNDIKQFKNDRLYQIGHFTPVVLDRGTHIGCAMIRFTNPGDKKFINVIATCDYGGSHMNEKPVYEPGTPASGCTTGKNPEFPGLCTIKEHFDVNWW